MRVFNKNILACSVSASLLLVGSASAQTWAPAPANGWVIDSSAANILTLQQTTTLNCVVDGAQVQTFTATTGQLNAFSLVPGSGSCSVLTPLGLPWQIVPIVGPSGGDGIRIVNLRIFTLLGECNGNLEGDWNDSAQELTFNNSMVPGTALFTTWNCYVNGTIKFKPGGSNNLPLIVTT